MSPLRPLLAAVLVLLAGCATPAAETTPPPTEPSQPALLAFGPATALHAEGTGAEPSILVAPDGATLYATAPGGAVAEPNAHEARTWLWRSTDGGATWETIRSPIGGIGEGRFCSCDADIDLADDGRLYLSDFYVTPAAFRNYVVQSSTDGGATWSTGSPLTSPAAINDRQWVLAGQGDRVYLFANAVPVPVATLQAGHWMARSDDAGLTWTAFRLAIPNEAFYPYAGHARDLSDGTLVIPYVRQTADPNDRPSVNLSVSTDGGDTWTRSKAADEPDGIAAAFPTSLAVGEGDRLALAWNARLGNGSVIRMSFSTDKGTTWTPPVAVSETTGHHVLPWVAPMPDGRFVVAYYATEIEGEMAELPETAEWHAWVSVVDAATPEAFLLGRASDAPALRGGLCAPYAGNCGNRHLRDFLGVASDDGGRIHVVYTVSPNADERYVYVASSLQAPPASGASSR